MTEAAVSLQQSAFSLLIKLIKLGIMSAYPFDFFAES